MSELGLDRSYSPSYSKRIKLTNQIGTGFFIIAWPFVGFFALLGLHQQAIGVLVLIGFWALTPLLNLFKWHLLSRFNLIIALNSSILIYSYWLGVESGVPLVSFAAIVLPFILYEFQDDWNKVTGLILTVGTASFLMSPWNESRDQWGLDIQVQETIANFLIPYVFLVLLVIIYSWYRQNALTERELEHHINELEIASKHKDEFFANMSHELRTPMNGILGMNQLLQETQLDAEQYEYTQDIGLSADTMLGLINDILDFSKIESGKFTIDTYEFNLLEMIESVAAIVKNKMGEKGVEFFIYLDPKLPEIIIGDGLRLKQILLNLLGNASKFTQQGLIKLEVRSYSSIQDNHKVSFEVIDTGIGIAQEKLDKIFESFSQADGSISRQFGGTGLGLSISKNLISLMDGKIYVKSTEGEGSTFGALLEFDAPSQAPRYQSNQLSTTVMVCPDPMLRDTFEEHFAQATLVEQLSEVDTWGQYNTVFAPLEYYLEETTQSQIPQIQLAHSLNPHINWVVSLDAHQSIKLLSQIPLRGLKLSVYKKPWMGDRTLDKVIPYSEIGVVPTPMIGDAPQSLAPEPSSETVSVAKKVLLAEDNLMNQKLMIRIFNKLNIDVDVANNGQEALSAVDEYQYPVIFMDLQMPGMGGLEATVHIRELEKVKMRDKSHIIALTANSQESNEQQCLDAGMDDFLTKPIQVKSIEVKLKSQGLIL